MSGTGTGQEVTHSEKPDEEFGVVERPLTRWQKLKDSALFRKCTIVVLIACIWQVYSSRLGNPFVLPTFFDTVAAFFSTLVSGEILARTWFSIKILLMGYSTGIVLAAILTTLAATTRIGNDILELLTAMFNPMPAIALLPLAMIWFGLGIGSFIFVLTHSVLWAVALNTNAGFRAVSPTLRMVGRNYGISGFEYIAKILIPAAFPSILSGLRIGWAFAWRTLIAAELVFGVSSQSGGLGWFIFEYKNMLDTPSVFAGLLMVILVGLTIEYLLFGTVEKKTIKRWGMHT
ncbi:MAG: ABC transporter permease [Proteobacteria bacterium]|nr:MAG: ABC transporter permease [Pseudomonadota bacterium]